MSCSQAAQIWFYFRCMKMRKLLLLYQGNHYFFADRHLIYFTSFIYSNKFLKLNSSARICAIHPNKHSHCDKEISIFIHNFLKLLVCYFLFVQLQFIHIMGLGTH